MRGVEERQAAMFSYVSPEQRVPKDHPLRPIRQMVDAALEQLSPRFDRLYASSGRPSIAPEYLLRALLICQHAIQALACHLGGPPLELGFSLLWVDAVAHPP